MNDLTEYMNGAIENIVRQALKSSLNNPLESAFFLKFIQAQKASAKKRLTSEVHIPSFLIASIATQCNLKCKGCYARANGACCSMEAPSMESPEELSAEQWNCIFTEAIQLGIPFILLAGGEPLTRRDVLEAAAKQTKVIFPVFTNGTMFDTEYLGLFHKNRNLIPVFSLEGDGAKTDERRGSGVYARLSKTMTQMNAKGIFYGASITVTTQNIELVSDPAFLSQLYENGCKLVIFVEYVPVESATQNLAPADREREFLAERLEVLREQFENMILLSFPGDEKSLGGCLAAGRGFFHISATGAAEPCPFSPYSDTSLKDRSLLEALQSPLFRRLNDEGILQADHEGGCVLFEKREEVMQISNKSI